MEDYIQVHKNWKQACRCS